VSVEEYEVSVALRFRTENEAVAFINRKSWRKGARLKRIVIHQTHSEDEERELEAKLK
jgi:hypothetical protein